MIGVILIVVLLVVGVFLASSIALSRTTHEVGSAREDEYLELEGNWVRYRVSGGGPPVLLVHGWLQSGRVWRSLAERLEGRFTVYSLDLVGFGESDKPISGYGIRYGSRLLYAFCAHFGLTKAAVVGQDLGGAMALKLAADHPDVVGKLVLVATPADEDQIDLPTSLWLATLPVVGPIFYSLGRFGGPVRRLWMRPFVLEKSSLTEDLVEDAGKSTPAAVGKSLSVMKREISRGRLARQVSPVRVPVLAVAGEEDEIVDPQSTQNWSRAVNARVVLLNDCGHLPALERPREFEAQVLAFLTNDERHLEALKQAPPAEPLPADDETELLEDDANEAPNVFRKKSGRYTPEPPVEYDEAELLNGGGGDRTDGEDALRETPFRNQPHSRNGAERRVPGWHPPGRDSGERADEPERTTSDHAPANPIPEVPRDLFEWPTAWREFRPGDSSKDSSAQPGAQDHGSDDAGRDVERGNDEVGEAEGNRPPRS